MEPVVQRLKAFLEYKELSTSAFSRQLRYRSCEKIARLFRSNKGAMPSVRILEDIARYFPELDIHWLLTGNKSRMAVFLVTPSDQAGIPDPDNPFQEAAALPCEEPGQLNN